MKKIYSHMKSKNANPYLLGMLRRLCLFIRLAYALGNNLSYHLASSAQEETGIHCCWLGYEN